MAYVVLECYYQSCGNLIARDFDDYTKSVPTLEAAWQLLYSTMLDWIYSEFPDSDLPQVPPTMISAGLPAFVEYVRQVLVDYGYTAVVYHDLKGSWCHIVPPVSDSYDEDLVIISYTVTSDYVYFQLSFCHDKGTGLFGKLIFDQPNYSTYV
jgi:hypothetical protein